MAFDFYADPSFSEEESASILTQINSITAGIQAAEYLSRHLNAVPRDWRNVSRAVRGVNSDYRAHFEAISLLLDDKEALTLSREDAVDRAKSELTVRKRYDRELAIARDLAAQHPGSDALENAVRALATAVSEHNRFDDSLEYRQPRLLKQRDRRLYPAVTREFVAVVGPHGLWRHLMEFLVKSCRENVRAMESVWTASEEIFDDPSLVSDYAQYLHVLGSDFTEHAVRNLRIAAWVLGAHGHALTERQRVHIEAMAPDLDRLPPEDAFEFKLNTWAMAQFINEKHQQGDYRTDWKNVRYPRGQQYDLARMLRAVRELIDLHNFKPMKKLTGAIENIAQAWIATDGAAFNGYVSFAVERVSPPIEETNPDTPPSEDDLGTTVQEHDARLTKLEEEVFG